MLDAYPIEIWNGGKIRRINNSVIYLMLGQVYEIEGKKFFTFGGADSHDKEYRKEGKTWWSREMPSSIEYEEGLINLDQHNWKVDYVVAHTCSSGTLALIADQLGIKYPLDPMHSYFQQISERLQYKKWFFGHFHRDIEFPKDQRLLYSDMVKLI
jgi:DNA repair exonuclease SbcCD nuclease subunit